MATVDDPHNTNAGMEDDLYKEVDADPDLGANFRDVHNTDGYHFISTIAKVLQTLSVGAVDATNYAVHAMKNRPTSTCKFAKPCNHVLPSYDPSFFDIYGHGNILRASH